VFKRMELFGGKLHSGSRRLSKEGVAMMILILIGVLVGAALGLRFKAFVLVPVICVVACTIAIGGGARGDDLWALAGLMIGITTALQVGYIGGCVARLVMERPGRGLPPEMEDGEPLLSGGTASWWSGSVGRFDGSVRYRPAPPTLTVAGDPRGDDDADEAPGQQRRKNRRATRVR
jgi:hypothetical protein